MIDSKDKPLVQRATYINQSSTLKLSPPSKMADVKVAVHRKPMQPFNSYPHWFKEDEKKKHQNDRNRYPEDVIRKCQSQWMAYALLLREWLITEYDGPLVPSALSEELRLIGSSTELYLKDHIADFYPEEPAFEHNMRIDPNYFIVEMWTNVWVCIPSGSLLDITVNRLKLKDAAEDLLVEAVGMMAEDAKYDEETDDPANPFTRLVQFGGRMFGANSAYLSLVWTLHGPTLSTFKAALSKAGLDPAKLEQIRGKLLNVIVRDGIRASLGKRKRAQERVPSSPVTDVDGNQSPRAFNDHESELIEIFPDHPLAKRARTDGVAAPADSAAKADMDVVMS